MFKTAVNCFLLMLFMFSLTAQPAWALPPEIEADRFLLAAMNKMDAKDYAGAITYFDKIIALKVPLPDDLYYNYGKVLGHTGDHNGAYKQYEIYLTKAGRGGKYYMEALQGLTDAEQGIEKTREKAKIAAEQARKKAREQAEVARINARWAATEHIVEGDTLKKKGKCKEAIVSYNKALEIEVYADVLDKRGQCYTHYSLKPKEYGKAILDFNKAIDIDPDNASYYFNRGKARHSVKNYTKAVGDFSEAIKRDSGDASMYKSRGWSLKALKKYDEAVADFTKVIELQPEKDLHYTYGYRAECWEDKGELDKAMADRNMAIAKYTGKYTSTKARLYTNRGNLWKKKKDFDKAITDFTTAIGLDSKSTSALEARGRTLLDDKKDPVKAIDDFNRMLEINPKSYASYYYRGRAWREKKEWARSIGDFTEYIKHYPKWFWGHYLRGVAGVS